MCISVAFNYRLNLVSETIDKRAKHLFILFKPVDCDSITSFMTQSLPVRRKATEIATKGILFNAHEKNI